MLDEESVGFGWGVLEWCGLLGFKNMPVILLIALVSGWTE